LLSILPFYLPFFFNVDLRVLRSLRLARLLRIFKANRYTYAIQKVLFVIKNKSTELLSSIFVIFVLMLISSVLMYSVESPVQPEVFKNGFSGLWWAVATFTTVGYGDIYPITSIGRFLSAIIALLGIGLVAVPTGIVTSGFMEANSEENENENSSDDEKHFCPYCGKNLD
jgi:voltage-gated potassium channel